MAAVLQWHPTLTASIYNLFLSFLTVCMSVGDGFVPVWYGGVQRKTTDVLNQELQMTMGHLIAAGALYH